MYNVLAAQILTLSKMVGSWRNLICIYIHMDVLDDFMLFLFSNKIQDGRNDVIIADFSKWSKLLEIVQIFLLVCILMICCFYIDWSGHFDGIIIKHLCSLSKQRYFNYFEKLKKNVVLPRPEIREKILVNQCKTL